MKTAEKNNTSVFEQFACRVSKATGTTAAFSCAFLVVIAWAATGPFFGYSETWQLVINTGTTIITFLMVFLIQKAQNKDSLAIQLKLNELVASNDYSSNRLVDIENMTEEEMIAVQKYYRRLSELSAEDESLHASHSIEEAHKNDQYKDKKQAQRDKTMKASPKTTNLITDKSSSKPKTPVKNHDLRAKR